MFGSVLYEMEREECVLHILFASGKWAISDDLSMITVDCEILFVCTLNHLYYYEGSSKLDILLTE